MVACCRAAPTVLTALSYEPLSYDFIVLRFDYDSATDIVYVELYEDGFCLDKPPE